MRGDNHVPILETRARCANDNPALVLGNLVHEPPRSDQVLAMEIKAYKSPLVIYGKLDHVPTVANFLACYSGHGEG